MTQNLVLRMHVFCFLSNQSLTKQLHGWNKTGNCLRFFFRDWRVVWFITHWSRNLKKDVLPQDRLGISVTEQNFSSSSKYMPAGSKLDIIVPWFLLLNNHKWIETGKKSPCVSGSESQFLDYISDSQTPTGEFRTRRVSSSQTLLEFENCSKCLRGWGHLSVCLRGWGHHYNCVASGHMLELVPDCDCKVRSGLQSFYLLF